MRTKNDTLNSIRQDLKGGDGVPDLPTHENIAAKNSRPVREYPTGLEQSSVKSSDGLNLIGVMLETAFFFSLFEYMAHRRFSGRTGVVRIGKMVDRHPRLYKASVWGDFIVRIVVVIALVVAAIYSAYKVLR